MNKKLKMRLFWLLLGFLSTATIGIDYFFTYQWREILKEESKKTFEVEVEADMCNALTGRNYFSTRYLMKQMIAEKLQKIELVRGNCTRGENSLLRISKKE